MSGSTRHRLFYSLRRLLPRQLRYAAIFDIIEGFIWRHWIFCPKTQWGNWIAFTDESERDESFVLLQSRMRRIVPTKYQDDVVYIHKQAMCLMPASVAWKYNPPTPEAI